MAKPGGPGRAGGDADPNGPTRSRRSARADAGSVSAGQEVAADEARLGRPGGNVGSDENGSRNSHTGENRADNGFGGQNPDLVTEPSGEPGGTPSGPPTRIRPNEDAEVRRSLERENSGAAILADKGFDIKQNPTPAEVAQARQDSGDAGRPTSKPDYLIEGRVFDAYSPSENKGARGIGFEVNEKVANEQTQRVVLNLEDWRGDIAKLQKQFDDWPVENLKELKAITPMGEIIQIFPKS